MASTELNTRSLSLKYVFIRLDGILLVGGRCFHVRMNYLLWASIVNAGSRMPKAGRIYFVIHFKLYMSSLTIKSSEDDIYINERKSEIIILSRFVVVQLLHIYIDHWSFLSMYQKFKLHSTVINSWYSCIWPKKIVLFSWEQKFSFVMSYMYMYVSRNIATFLLSLYFSRHIYIHFQYDMFGIRVLI